MAPVGSPDEEERARILRLLAALDPGEAEARTAALLLYLEELRRWSRAYALVGPNESPRLVDRHVRPSLLLASRLAPTASVLDVGSGAGFPGLVIALADPARRVVLVERNGKKARFLDHVRRRLGLGRLEVVHGDVHALETSPFDAVTARAWGSARALLEASARLAHPATVWYLLKGPRGAREAADLPAGWHGTWSPLDPGTPPGGRDFLLTVVRSNPPSSSGCDA